MSVYKDERKGKRASNDAVQYFLNKFREDFHKIENERRATLRRQSNA